jgi:hypothetical protein
MLNKTVAPEIANIRAAITDVLEADQPRARRSGSAALRQTMAAGNGGRA